MSMMHEKNKYKYYQRSIVNGCYVQRESTNGRTTGRMKEQRTDFIYLLFHPFSKNSNSDLIYFRSAKK